MNKQINFISRADVATDVAQTKKARCHVAAYGHADVFACVWARDNMHL